MRPRCPPGRRSKWQHCARRARSGWTTRSARCAPGKLADLTAVRLDEIETSPCYDPVSHLVYAAGREQVSHVWVNGKLVLDDRMLTTMDTHEITARAAYWRDRIGAP